jgi:hypothetical protein
MMPGAGRSRRLPPAVCLIALAGIAQHGRQHRPQLRIGRLERDRVPQKALGFRNGRTKTRSFAVWLM